MALDPDKMTDDCLAKLAEWGMPAGPESIPAPIAALMVAAGKDPEKMGLWGIIRAIMETVHEHVTKEAEVCELLLDEGGSPVLDDKGRTQAGSEVLGKVK